MSESENKGGDFVPLQKENESDFHTAKPTEVSQGSEGSSGGGDSSGQQEGSSGGETTQARDDVKYVDNQAKPGEKQGYPLPSEMAEQEREQESQKEGEQQQEQQQQQQQQQKEESSSEQKQESSGDDKKEGEGEEKKSSKVGRVQENPDSIPTAGGEQLGQKHWGESEMVPDVPKLKDDDKVSSGEGQPDQQTKDNTAKNTGDGGGEGGDSEEPKKGTIEKLKDKLGLNKDKE